MSAMTEMDLHGLTVDEALRVFVEFYNRRVRSSREPLRIVRLHHAGGRVTAAYVLPRRGRTPLANSVYVTTIRAT